MASHLIELVASLPLGSAVMLRPVRARGKVTTPPRSGQVPLANRHRQRAGRRYVSGAIMAQPPPCRRLGRHCRALDVTLRVAAIEGEEDHDATWLLGHTERIDFGPLFEREGELWCGATIHVPCRYFEEGEDGAPAHCTAHGYRGRPRKTVPERASRRAGGDRFEIVEQGRLRRRELPPPPPPPAGRPALPLAPEAANPCATARCRTSDNTIGSACCRDLQVDICCTTKERHLEALIRTRKAPYLCKAERENDDQLVVEIISACSFLTDIGCSLHGRKRRDGRPAKPLMCSAWPENRATLHTGCAYRNRRLKLHRVTD